MDEVDVSYKSFVVQFSGKIAALIMRDKGWTLTQTQNFIKSKFNYDPYVKSVMDRVIEEFEPKIVLNRNPKMYCGIVKSF